MGIDGIVTEIICESFCYEKVSESDNVECSAVIVWQDPDFYFTL